MDGLAQLLSHLGSGFAVALTPTNLLFGFSGVVLGTAVGVLPGLGPAVTISLLLPMTFGLDPTSAFIMFGGIYYGAMYGGSTTSILVNTPGEAASVVTTLDGFRMAQSGRAGAALATAAIGSFIAGTVATFLLMLLAPALVEVALRFGPPEYFGLLLLALTSVGALGSGSPWKALFSTCLGLALGTIGIDLQTGEARLTFGLPQLMGGIDVVLGAMGLFAIGEVLWAASTGQGSEEQIVARAGPPRLSGADWRRSAPAWLRGTAVGFGVGVLPGAGATLATFLSYALERRLSRHPDEFGSGAIEGVAGPEAANNASAGGSLVPLLALGIPGSGTTAMLLAAFQLYGLRPGPLLFAEKPQLVWGLIASLYVGNALLLVLNLPLVGLWVRLLRVPRPLLFGSIVVFSTMGAYSLNGSVADLLVLYALGVAGFFLRKGGLPLAPVILGLVLGPLLEQEFRRSLAISSGDPSIFFTRPLSVIFLSLAVLAAGGPLLTRRRRA
jgi:putative tricarboxylic transport membrane protein